MGNCCACNEREKLDVGKEKQPSICGQSLERPGCLYVYDERMILHEDTLHGDEQPERPLRISAIDSYLKTKGLLDTVVNLEIEQSLTFQENAQEISYPELE